MESKEVMLGFMSFDFSNAFVHYLENSCPLYIFPSLWRRKPEMLGHLRMVPLLPSAFPLFWGFWESISQEAKNAG